MFEENTEPNQFFSGSSQALLERVMCAEYLLAKGYLTSDLEELPPQVTKNLVTEACRFATRRLAEFGLIESFPFWLSFSLN
jgi:hypothetical protein